MLLRLILIALPAVVAELASFDHRGEESPVLAAVVGAGEERVLAIQRNRSD
jgi:hypothetical protein